MQKIMAAAVFAVSSGTLLMRQRRATKRLERLGGATFEALLNAIDANDSVTGAHVRRVARSALILADAAGTDQRTRCAVERVALFHDIGKIHEALFDMIHDRSKLTPAERKEIETHPERGAEVLEPLAAFYPELPRGVAAHHERWDGTGYPRGLKGRRIPITARIVAIADSFDAITHSRRYSHARSLAEATEAILAERGGQFDPELVDLFLSPPIISDVAAAMREPSDAAPKASGKRHEGGEQLDVPDVTFRWRGVKPGQRRRGRGRQAAR